MRPALHIHARVWLRSRAHARTRLVIAGLLAMLIILLAAPGQAGAVTVSGNAVTTSTGTAAWSGCHATNQNLRLRINQGASEWSARCDTTTGAFTFTGVTIPAGTNTLTVFMAPGAGHGLGAVMYRTDDSAGNVTGLNLSHQHVRLQRRVACGGCQFTASVINAAWDSSASGGAVPIDASATGLTSTSVNGTPTVLTVGPDTSYTAAGTDTIDKLRLEGGWVAGSYLLVLRTNDATSSFTNCFSAPATADAGGTMCVPSTGSFDAGTGTVRFTNEHSDNMTDVRGQIDFYVLEVRPATELSTGSGVTFATHGTNRAAHISIGNGGNHVRVQVCTTLAATLAHANPALSGTIDIQDDANLRACGFFTRIEARNGLSGAGSVTSGTSGALLDLRICPDAGRTAVVGSTSGSTDWEFNTAYFYTPSSSSSTVQWASGGTGRIWVQSFVVGRNGDGLDCAAGAGSIVFNADTADRDLRFNGGGIFRVGNRGVYNASNVYDLTLAGGNVEVDGSSNPAYFVGNGRALTVPDGGDVVVEMGGGGSHTAVLTGNSSITVDGDVRVEADATLSGTRTALLELDGALNVGGSVTVSSTASGVGTAISGLQSNGHAVTIGEDLLIETDNAAGNEALVEMDGSAVTVGDDVTILRSGAGGTSSYETIGAGAMTLGGDLHRDASATFDAASGHVTFVGSGTSYLTNGGAAMTLYDLRNETPGKILRMDASAPWTVGGQLRLQGGSCANRAGLASTHDHVQLTMQVASGVVQFADIGDVNQTNGTLTAASSFGAAPESNNTGWTFTTPCATNVVSGTAYEWADTLTVWSSCAAGVDNVVLDINGYKPIRTDCDPVTGAFSFDAIPVTDGLAVVFLGSGDPANRGATYMRTNAGNLTGVTVSRSQVRIAPTTGQPTFDTSLLERYDADIHPRHVDVTDLPIDADATGIYASAGTELYIADSPGHTMWSPGRPITAWALDLAGSLSSLTTPSITLLGSGTSANCGDPVDVSVPFCIRATGDHQHVSLQTFTYAGTDAVHVWPDTYGALNLEPAGAAAPTWQLGVAGHATNSFQTPQLTVGSDDADADVTVSNTLWDAQVLVEGRLAINRNASFGGNSSRETTVLGDVAGAGAVDLTNGTFNWFHFIDAQMGTADASPWTYRFHELRSASGAVFTGLIRRGGHVHVRGDLTVGHLTSAPNSDTWQHEAGANVTTLDVDGDVTILEAGVLTAPASTAADAFTIGGSLTNDGVLNASSGRVTFDGTAASSVLGAANTSFAQLAMSGPPKSLRFSTAVTTSVTDALLATGTSCLNPVVLESTSAGVVATVNVSGSANLQYATIRDLSTATPQTVSLTGDLGALNAGWTFTGGCPFLATEQLFVHPTDAQTGDANPLQLTVEDPHLSVVNATQMDAVQQQVRVLSTPLDDDVVALWHLDGSATTEDASANGLDLTLGGGASGGASGRAAFDEALILNGTSQSASTSANELALGTDFTVEAWVRPDSLTGTRTIIDRSSGADVTFRLQVTGGQLEARAGGAVASVPVAGALSVGTWSHVALTLDGGTLTLYVDGDAVATTAAGVSWTGAATTTIGAASGGGGWLAGRLDDARISGVARSEDELAGYAALEFPHGTELWRSVATAGACATAARCADVEYDGPALTRAGGGRWYASARMLQDDWSTWSAWSDGDWFVAETLVLELSVLPTATLGMAAPGDVMTATSAISVETNVAGGYELFARDDQHGASNIGMSGDGVMPDWTASASSPQPWPLATLGYFGLTVVDATGGKQTGRWGSATDLDDDAAIAAHSWIGVDDTDGLLHAGPTTSGDTVTVGYRAAAAMSQAPGDYTSTITYTLIPDV